MRVLVTGGAGYIGAVVVEELQAAGAERVVVLDDLSKGRLDAVAQPASLIVGSVGDRQLVAQVCGDEHIEAVVHLAASSLVSESMRDPARYYAQNMVASLALLDGMRDAGVGHLVLSSTAAVYGEPDASPITEQFPTRPTNAYGETKLALERALAWYAPAYGLSFASLRYFNAAGATDGHGEDHDPETHLIPLVLAAAAGEGGPVAVFGDDYPTPDGTCVRDYIHVSDLARAHVLALRARAGGEVYNLGTGTGYSVRQVIAAAEEVTGRSVPVRMAPRRPGDPAVLVASADRIRRRLGWQPRTVDLRTIVADAWRWREKRRRESVATAVSESEAAIASRT